jgi:DNA-binding GntR family transcriptional regulator
VATSKGENTVMTKVHTPARMDVDESDASNLHLLPKTLLAQNVPAHVQDVLYGAILNGVLAPGERLLVDEVAQHFGVRKIPVREALKSLEASGWVEIRPRRGTFVRPLSSEELRQIFEMRRVLEPYSARVAAERRTPQQLKEMEKLVREGERAIRSGDVARTSDANSRFHSVMAEAVGNQLLGNTVTSLEARMRRYFVAVDWQQRSESMAQHAAIYQAIANGDGARAEKLTLAHLAHTEALAFTSVEEPVSSHAPKRRTGSR